MEDLKHSWYPSSVSLYNHRGIKETIFQQEVWTEACEYDCSLNGLYKPIS